MSRTELLVVEEGAGGPRGALVDRGGRLLELIEPAADDPTDRLFVARVRRVEPSLKAAFVEIGPGETAWLGVGERRPGAKGRELGPTRRPLSEGQRLIVQGTRAAQAGKGPRVTEDIALPGFLLAFRPGGEGVGLSRSIPKTSRTAQAARVQALPAGEGGVVLRALAQEATDAELAAEMALLRARWRALAAEAATRDTPGPLSPFAEPLERLLLAAPLADLAAIRVADPSLARRLHRLIAPRLAMLAGRIERVQGGHAFEALGIAEQIEQALRPEVPLPSGGRLIVEPTAALVAIDVDGGARGRRDALSLDLEAAAEIARQLRLRALAGTIVVDFLPVRGHQGWATLLAHLRRAFACLEPPVAVHALPAPGLVVLTRERRGPSLAERHLRPCPHCEGSGRIEVPAA